MRLIYIRHVNVDDYTQCRQYRCDGCKKIICIDGINYCPFCGVEFTEIFCLNGLNYDGYTVRRKYSKGYNRVLTDIVILEVGTYWEGARVEEIINFSLGFSQNRKAIISRVKYLKEDYIEYEWLKKDFDLEFYLMVNGRIVKKVDMYNIETLF